MKRAEINALVSEILAEKGYSPAAILWRRAELTAWSDGIACTRVKLFSGISERSLRAILATFPTVGPARKTTRMGRRSKGSQIDLEDAIDAINGVAVTTGHALHTNETSKGAML